VTGWKGDWLVGGKVERKTPERKRKERGRASRIELADDE